MTLSSLKDENLQKILSEIGYDSLYPIQEQAISNGLLTGENLLITSPTASGKTLIAIMAAFKKMEKKEKVIYMTPLRSLATEKYHDFLEFNSINFINNNKNLATVTKNIDFEKKNSLAKKKKGDKKKSFIVKLAMGNYDSAGNDLLNADIVILTNEKLDALIRNDSELLSNVGLFVIDEVHLMGDKDRGPTLEMMITKIKRFYQEAQILALSATAVSYTHLRAHETDSYLVCR